MFLIFLSLFSFLSAHADESTVRLESIPVSATGSFETLSDDTYLPQKKVSFTDSDQQGTTLDTISKQEVFPVVNQGYPSGESTVSTGGRSSNDTQAFTLGVPLNLPQGGGPDLSIFPSFLWSGAILSPGLSSAGFTPQAASGSLQLIPWSREMVRANDNPHAPVSRFTSTYDRDLQTFAMGTKKENLAILAGGTFGRETGPAGELSYYLLHTSQNHLLFHVIGTSQKGDSPGSIQFPAPLATKNVWRVIPVLESHQELEGNVILESTLYADFQSVLYEDPDPNPNNLNSSDDRTQQYGIENALMVGPYTFALSARYLNYVNSSYTPFSTNQIHAQDWPLFGSATRDFFLTDHLNAKVTANVTDVQSAGVAPGGKIALKRELDQDRYFFSELNTVAKMPSVLDRYAVYGTFYHGNPNLKPERVNAFLVGYDQKGKELEATTTVKAEYRNQIQVASADGTTQVNAGNADLVYLQQNVAWQFHPQFKLSEMTLLTYSQLNDSGLPYPNLPYFSQQLGLDYAPNDWLQISGLGHYVGPSKEYTGAFHADYLLADLTASYLYTKDFRFTAGVENIFDSRAQLVLGYPLPGREVFLSMQANF